MVQAESIDAKRARLEKERADFVRDLESTHDAIARDVASVAQFARALFAPFLPRK